MTQFKPQHRLKSAKYGYIGIVPISRHMITWVLRYILIDSINFYLNTGSGILH